MKRFSKSRVLKVAGASVLLALVAWGVSDLTMPNFFGPREKLPDEGEKGENPWRGWKDPLSESELKALMRDEGRIRQEKGGASKKASEPSVSPVSLKSPITFLGMTFGAVGTVSTNSCCYWIKDVMREFNPQVQLVLPYFCMSRVVETRSPASHRLAKIWLQYVDYTYAHGPSGRYGSGKDLLDEVRRIRVDVGRRMGTPLQELRLFRQIWPYHPGVKASQCWSGPIPDKYLCSEDEWVNARHSFAYSRTISGDYRIDISARQIYYDERSVSVVITDLKESLRSEREFATEFLKKHKPEELRVYGVDTGLIQGFD